MGLMSVLVQSMPMLSLCSPVRKASGFVQHTSRRTMAPGNIITIFDHISKHLSLSAFKFQMVRIWPLQSRPVKCVAHYGNRGYMTLTRFNRSLKVTITSHTYQHFTVLLVSVSYDSCSLSCFHFQRYLWPCMAYNVFVAHIFHQNETTCCFSNRSIQCAFMMFYVFTGNHWNHCYSGQ